MLNIKNNIGYFSKEAKTILKLNLASNLLSIFSVGLILFILILVATGWFISNEAIMKIQSEAEISLYYSEELKAAEVTVLAEKVKATDGVESTQLVTAEEAYSQMVEILGMDAEVLRHFEDNPFSSYIEVKIDIKEIDNVLQQLNTLVGVDYIRDNREVLQSLMDIEKALRLISYMVFIAVGIATLVIVTHLIRSGIYNSREEIITLRLLGAPESFISIPFVLSGLLLALGGGFLAILLSTGVLRLIYGQMLGPLPFIPLPDQGRIISKIVTLTIPLSIVLGVAGSYFGLKSAAES